MENQNLVKAPSKWSSLLVALMFVGWGLFLFFVVYDSYRNSDFRVIPVSNEKNVGLNEILNMGKQNLKHEDLLSQIRKDLKIPQDLGVKIFVGPYLIISGEGRLVYSTNPFAFILLLDETFYESLDREEKVALIAHELGHLTNEMLFIIHDPDIGIKFQIEADTYATKYASPEAMISTLNKANTRPSGLINSRQYKLRIQNLEKIKLSQQGH